MKSLSQKLFVLGSASLLLLTGCNGTQTTSSTTGTETTTTTTETAVSPASSPVASPVAAETNASPMASTAGTETKTTTSTTETTTTATAPTNTGTDTTNTANTATSPATGSDVASTSTTTTTTTTTTSSETATAAEAKKGGQAVKFADYHLELVTASQDTGTKVDFYLSANEAGTVIPDATVTATVKTPSGETKEVAMTYDTTTESYTATLPDTAPGSYEVAVSSTVKDEKVEGNFTVQR